MGKVEKKKVEEKNGCGNGKWEWRRHCSGLKKILDWKGQFDVWSCLSNWIGSIKWPIWLHKAGHYYGKGTTI